MSILALVLNLCHLKIAVLVLTTSQNCFEHNNCHPWGLHVYLFGFFLYVDIGLDYGVVVSTLILEQEGLGSNPFVYNFCALLFHTWCFSRHSSFFSQSKNPFDWSVDDSKLTLMSVCDCLSMQWTILGEPHFHPKVAGKLWPQLALQ